MSAENYLCLNDQHTLRIPPKQRALVISGGKPFEGVKKLCSGCHRTVGMCVKDEKKVWAQTPKLCLCVVILLKVSDGLSHICFVSILSQSTSFLRRERARRWNKIQINEISFGNAFFYWPWELLKTHFLFFFLHCWPARGFAVLLCCNTLFPNDSWVHRKWRRAVLILSSRLSSVGAIDVSMEWSASIVCVCFYSEY